MTGSIIISSDAIEDMMTSEPESCLGRHRVASLTEMRRVVEALAPVGMPCTLDLIGHSTRDAKLLRLGKTVVDMADVRIAQFFERLAHEHVARLQISSIRLLGCETAVEVVGQRTLRSLARTMGVKVYGTRKMIMKTHYGPEGFNEDFADVALVEAAQLPTPSRRLS